MHHRKITLVTPKEIHVLLLDMGKFDTICFGACKAVESNN